MIALIQRVTHASVAVDQKIVGQINAGLLVLLGVEKDDDEQKAKRLCEKYWATVFLVMNKGK